MFLFVRSEQKIEWLIRKWLLFRVFGCLLRFSYIFFSLMFATVTSSLWCLRDWQTVDYFENADQWLYLIIIIFDKKCHLMKSFFIWYWVLFFCHRMNWCLRKRDWTPITLTGLVNYSFILSFMFFCDVCDRRNDFWLNLFLWMMCICVSNCKKWAKNRMAHQKLIAVQCFCMFAQF